MSQSEVQRFATAVRTDKALQEEIKNAAVSNEAIVEFARSKGYDISLEEMIDHIEAKKATLSKEDLEKVVGGKSSTQHTQVRAQYLVFSVQEATVFTTTTTMVEAEVVIVAT